MPQQRSIDSSPANPLQCARPDFLARLPNLYRRIIAIDLTSMGASRPVTLFLCGDVMTGRGIDQILPHPSEPWLFESYVRSAVTYVELAEHVTGRKIPRPVDHAYIWGDALAELERVSPDARIVNLETSITVSDEPWPGKGIHYRMHPANVPCLTAARLECCVLANNHVMDWGRTGLAETLATLHRAGIHTAGAGCDAMAAAAPAISELADDARVLVFAFGMENGGVPFAWRATKDCPGVNMLDDLSARSIDVVAGQVAAHKRRGDIVVASLHWGPNWGYTISPAEREFAHALVDAAGVDVVHGHSSHHVKGIEVYRGKPILYGCGDFLNDYEGIGGYAAYRGDLALMYFPALEAGSGDLLRFSMIPTCTWQFRIHRAQPDDVTWLFEILNRESAKLGSAVARQPDGALTLQWS